VSLVAAVSLAASLLAGTRRDPALGTREHSAVPTCCREEFTGMG